LGAPRKCLRPLQAVVAEALAVPVAPVLVRVGRQSPLLLQLPLPLRRRIRTDRRL